MSGSWSGEPFLLGLGPVGQILLLVDRGSGWSGWLCEVS